MHTHIYFCECIINTLNVCHTLITIRILLSFLGDYISMSSCCEPFLYHVCIELLPIDSVLSLGTVCMKMRRPRAQSFCLEVLKSLWTKAMCQGHLLFLPRISCFLPAGDMGGEKNCNLYTGYSYQSIVSSSIVWYTLVIWFFSL